MAVDKITFEGKDIYALRDALGDAMSGAISEYRRGMADKSCITETVIHWMKLYKRMGFEPTGYITKVFPEEKWEEDIQEAKRRLNAILHEEV